MVRPRLHARGQPRPGQLLLGKGRARIRVARVHQRRAAGAGRPAALGGGIARRQQHRRGQARAQQADGATARGLPAGWGGWRAGAGLGGGGRLLRHVVGVGAVHVGSCQRQGIGAKQRKAAQGSESSQSSEAVQWAISRGLARSARGRARQGNGRCHGKRHSRHGLPADRVAGASLGRGPSQPGSLRSRNAPVWSGAASRAAHARPAPAHPEPP